ncbi:hypothetical protein GX51_01424 [Blastomyces parvus]|uniref:Uncharacterized protein n=1 Tax=Blastomyces parvus TaxID=2060905 RepID=A0A2B7X8I9_9EURO|nr:hypothetical protein GX51_01424 [Blastomyces parvus]
MKLATLFTSACLLVAAIASPIAQPQPVDVDVDVDKVDAQGQSPNPANIILDQIMFAPPYNWKPGLRLLGVVDTTYNYPQERPSVEFAYFLKLRCNSHPRCKSIAGVRRNGQWIGYIFTTPATRADFVRDYIYSDSFAFTS